MSHEVLLARELSAEDARAYDAFVLGAAGGHYTQARGWATMAAMGRRVSLRYFLCRRGGDVVGAGIVERVRAIGPVSLPVASLERGPVVTSVDDLAFVLPRLLRATRRRGILRLGVMPYFAGDGAPRAEAILADLGFRRSEAFDGAHARTLRVALDPPPAPSKNVKKEAKNAEKAGVTTRAATADDVPRIHRLFLAMMDAQGKKAKSLDTFRALARSASGRLFVSEIGETAMSAAFVARHGRIATYVLAASSLERTTYSKMVPTVLEAMRWAREEGCTTFDLGGIPLEGDTDEKRRSIAEFKFRFSKEPVSLVRQHTRWL